MERKWICLSCGFEATRLQILARHNGCVRCGHAMHAPRYQVERMRAESGTVFVRPGSVITSKKRKQ